MERIGWVGSVRGWIEGWSYLRPSCYAISHWCNAIGCLLWAEQKHKMIYICSSSDDVDLQLRLDALLLMERLETNSYGNKVIKNTIMNIHHQLTIKHSKTLNLIFDLNISMKMKCQNWYYVKTKYKRWIENWYFCEKEMESWFCRPDKQK